ncbi:MAG TPA: thiamine-phosphate kinase [Afifellaceae bacterium]|nr:thiamine-phosphate kinase [Afifellaceae bacterium]
MPAGRVRCRDDLAALAAADGHGGCAVAFDEHDLIERLFRPLAGPGSLDLQDDTALVVPPPGCDLVIAKDMIASGVHFLPEDPPESVARKALRVNLSDLAAKGAEPLGYLLGAGFGRRIGGNWIEAFCSGLAADQEIFGISLLGGDTIATSAGAVFSVTVIGTVPSGEMVMRSGGTPGDALYVTGFIGSAAAGLAIQSGSGAPWSGLEEAVKARLIEQYRLPEPAMALAPALRQHASAAMDISDGLVGDCDKLTAASGCTAVINARAVPIDPELIPETVEPDVLAGLFTGGDDYQILATIPTSDETPFCDAAAAAGVDVIRIGRLVAGAGPVTVLLDGEAMDLPARSYIHRQGAGGR